MTTIKNAIRLCKHRTIMVCIAMMVELFAIVVIKLMSTSSYTDIVVVFGVLLIGSQIHTVMNYVSNYKRLTARLVAMQQEWIIIDDDENVVYQHTTLQGLQTDNNLIFSSIPHSIITNYRVMNVATNELAGHIQKTVQYKWTPIQKEDT